MPARRPVIVVRELAAALRSRHAAGVDYALATVVAVHGSAPCEPGASMAVDAAGAVVGSLSAGCVEAAVHTLCVEVLAGGVPIREVFGYNESEPFGIGMGCGGTLEVYVQRVDAAVRPVIDAVLGSTGPAALMWDLRTGGVAVLLESDCMAREFVMHPVDCAGTSDRAAVERGIPVALESVWLGAPASPQVAAAVREMLASGTSGLRWIGGGAVESEMFVLSLWPPPRLLVFGAGHFSPALVRIGKCLGYHVTVCDARSVFTTRERFPEADEVVVDWPHRYLESAVVDARTVICVLAHDPKFEVPLLERALRLPVAFVGALGSRRTCAERAERLRAVGVSDTELARLHAPIGLDLGAGSPAETAVAIAAEIVAARTGATARPLRETVGPLHGSEGAWGAPVAGPRPNCRIVSSVVKP